MYSRPDCRFDLNPIPVCVSCIMQLLFATKLIAVIHVNGTERGRYLASLITNRTYERQLTDTVGYDLFANGMRVDRLGYERENATLIG